MELFRVRDLKGGLHEMALANARDMVAILGWRFLGASKPGVNLAAESALVKVEAQHDMHAAIKGKTSVVKEEPAPAKAEVKEEPVKEPSFPKARQRMDAPPAAVESKV